MTKQPRSILLDGIHASPWCGCGTQLEPQHGPTLVNHTGNRVCAECAEPIERAMEAAARDEWCVMSRRTDRLHAFLHDDCGKAIPAEHALRMVAEARAELADLAPVACAYEKALTLLGVDVQAIYNSVRGQIN